MTTSKSPALTHARLVELLSYDPTTGGFLWLKATTNRVTPGAPAGAVMNNGYISIGVDGGNFYAHRLAWFYTFGEWPVLHIDHIDRVKTNNALSNLRQVTCAENQHNCKNRRNNKSGVRGVSWDRASGRWLAKICLNRKQMYLGLFDSIGEASAAYRGAQTELHPAYVGDANDSR
jgi:hypothetical protein